MISSIELSQGLIPLEDVSIEPIERRANIKISNITFNSLRGLNEHLVDLVLRAEWSPDDEQYSLKNVSVRITLKYCDGTECKITINDLSSITQNVVKEGLKFNIGLVLYNEQKQYIHNLCERRRTEYFGDGLHILHPDWSILCALDEEIKKTQQFLNRYDLGIER